MRNTLPKRGLNKSFIFFLKTKDNGDEKREDGKGKGGREGGKGKRGKGVI